ncbi:D-alanyl-D-alanine carboxypeptidase/D-alanyl-D-alanine-endopeptidase [Nibrella saemangeumensis]|uniref:D-alanyl-D-alanine carboxypeptidase/D-alanyl-D-alanine-endopeptidase n=1 Tax=Nibrella saemangeumensis TaxID=1084526 RepID=A0ABP8MY58_9BACT
MPVILPSVVRFAGTLLIAWQLLASPPGYAQTPYDTAVVNRLVSAVADFQQSPTARHGTVALSVRRVRDGEALVSYNAQQSLASASTLKLITTATALAVLGPSFTYTTSLEYDGTIRDSILTGNLYIRGSGDPSLGSWRYGDSYEASSLLQTWSDAIRGAGIRQIQGAIVADASLYDQLPVPDTWPWGDLGNYYGTGLSALNFNENLYRVVFRPGKTPGAAATMVRTEPPLPYLTLSNRVTTDAPRTGDQVTIYSAPFGNQVWLEGKVPAGVNEFGVKGALPDPAYQAAFALTQQIQADSIVVTNPPSVFRARTALPMPEGKRTLLLQHKSPPLPEIVRQTNFQSINLYAEALLHTTARTLDPKVTTTQAAIEAVTTYWRSKNINLDGFRIKDGSGLSTVGALTADNMTSILSAAGKEKYFPQFLETIPVVGESGTVRTLARRTEAAGNIRAKSGSIEGVRAYAGYFTATDGELMTFSLMVNRFTPGTNRAVTSQIERILSLLVTLPGHTEPAAADTK